MGWVFALVVAALAACLVWARRLQKEKKRQQAMVARLRASRVYRGVYEMLSALPQRDVERVEIRPEALRVFLLPRSEKKSYEFDRHGIDPLQPGPLLALAQAVAMDLPGVTEKAYYAFRTEHDYLPSGKETIWYSYTLRPERKNYLLRAMREGRTG